jgi:aspartyl-tRNA(Asn)/glutamyl-tRNA(Gln) amidotransferase subunit A
MTRTVRDNALALNAIAEYDPRDAGSIDVPVPDYTEQLEEGVAGMRLGVPINYFFDNVDPFVEETVRAAIASLESAGALLREVQIPYAEHYLYAHFGIMVPESSAYHRQWLLARADDYGEDVRTFLEMGALIPAGDYITSLRVREKIKWAWRDTFNELQLNAIVAPTPPLPASKVGQKTWVMPDGNEESILVAFSRLTVPSDLTGLPAITVPCGATDENLPVGLQIIGRPFDEATVLRIARTLERSSGWEGRIAHL